MRYGFLDFELDDQLFELSRGGTRLAIQPKALDVLVHLLRHRERVVSKQELMEAVWSGVKVQVNTLAQTVAVLRRALDDESAGRVVETVRTRGYRFIAEVREVGQRSSSPPPSPGGFVGREAMVEALSARLEAAASGRPGVVLVAGAPGLGKTRLLAEFAALARARATRVVEVRCYAQGAPDFWPWAQALRSLVKSHGLLAERDRSLLDELGELWPEARSVRATDAAGSNGADQRFRLFDRFANVLRLAAQREPVALLIDDMQWADLPSLLLLGFVAREFGDSRALIVVTYSDASMPPALARTVGALLREDPSRRLSLTPLGHGEIERLAVLRLGAAAPDLVERLADKTAGNPALLLQLLSGFESARLPADQDTSALLSDEGVREAIGIQLGALPPDCQELLSHAAVIGSEFDIASVARLTETEHAAVLDKLAEAVRARVVAKAARPDHFRFLHALVRDVLCRRLSATRRAEILASLGPEQSAPRP